MNYPAPRVVLAEMTATAQARAETAGPDLAAALGRALLAATCLARHLDAAQSVQWEASSHPGPREDTTERAAGGPPSDPTADTVADPARLAVRDAAEAGAERLAALARAVEWSQVPAALDCAAHAAAVSTDRLSEAVAAWHGE